MNTQNRFYIEMTDEQFENEESKEFELLVYREISKRHKIEKRIETYDEIVKKADEDNFKMLEEFKKATNYTELLMKKIDLIFVKNYYSSKKIHKDKNKNERLVFLINELIKTDPDALYQKYQKRSNYELFTYKKNPEKNYIKDFIKYVIL